MKKIILSLVIALISCIFASAQQFEAPSRTSSVEYTDTTTTFTYKIKDVVYDVYKSKKGAFYIWKMSSKSNKLYKYYLPKDIQKQMGRKYED